MRRICVTFAVVFALSGALSTTASANKVSGSCSESGFRLDTTVSFEVAGAKRSLWRVTRLAWRISGDASRHKNNVAFVLFDNTGHKANYENTSTTSNGRWFHHDVNWVLHKAGAKYEIQGIFDIPNAPDPSCFGGFFAL